MTKYSEPEETQRAQPESSRNTRRLAPIGTVSPNEIDMVVEVGMRARRIVSMVVPTSNGLTATDHFAALAWAEPLAQYAVVHGLSDEEVARQAHAKSGPAWEHAVKRMSEEQVRNSVVAQKLIANVLGVESQRVVYEPVS